MHKGDQSGSTTTMFKEDLPHLKHCIAQPYQPLPYAWINLNEVRILKLLSMLPPSAASHEHAMAAGQYIGRLPSYLRQASAQTYDKAFEFINRHWSDMPIQEKVPLCFSPIPWRDHRAVEIITSLLIQHKEQGTVAFFKTMEQTGHITLLESVEQMIAQGNIIAAPVNPDSQTAPATAGTPVSSNEVLNASSVPVSTSGGKPKLGPGLAQRRRVAAENLMQLETFHKVVVVYMWFSFKFPITYAEGEEVEKLKQRLEVAMNDLLKFMTNQLSEATVLKDIVYGKKRTTAEVVVDSGEQVAESLQV